MDSHNISRSKRLWGAIKTTAKKIPQAFKKDVAVPTTAHPSAKDLKAIPTSTGKGLLSRKSETIASPKSKSPNRDLETEKTNFKQAIDQYTGNETSNQAMEKVAEAAGRFHDAILAVAKTSEEAHQLAGKQIAEMLKDEWNSKSSDKDKLVDKLGYITGLIESSGKFNEDKLNESVFEAFNTLSKE